MPPALGALDFYPSSGPAVNPFGNAPMTLANATASNRWWQELAQRLSGNTGTWDPFGNYRPQYEFYFTDDTTSPLESGTGRPANMQSQDPAYNADLQYFLRASTGQPGSGWTFEDPGSSFWGNMAAVVQMATALGMGAGGIGSALGGGAAAGTAGTEAGVAGGATGAAVGEAGASGGLLSSGALLPGEVSAAGAAGGGGGALAAGGGVAAAGGATYPGLAAATGEMLPGEVAAAGAPAAAGGTAIGPGAGGLSLAQIGSALSKLGSVGSALGSVGSLAGGGAGGAAGPSTTTSTSNVLDPQARALLDLIIQKQFPARFGGFQDVMNAFTARAAASPQALEGLTTPQLRQMGQALLQAQHEASMLGPFGGAQVDRTRAGALSKLPVLSTFVDPVLQSQQDLSSFLGNAGLINPQGRTSKSQTDYPPNIGQIGTALTGLFGLGKGLYNAL